MFSDVLLAILFSFSVCYIIFFVYSLGFFLLSLERSKKPVLMTPKHYPDNVWLSENP